MCTMQDVFYAFLADIKASRSADDGERLSMQNRLRTVIEKLNNIFEQEMFAPLVFSSGDSVQCLFKSASASIRCYLLFSTLFSPYSIRAGIGAGDINRKMLEEETKHGWINSNYLDGPAYHLARKAIDLAKELDARVLVFSSKCNQSRIINNMLIEACEHRKRLSPSQEKLLTLCEYLNPILNEEESVSYSNSFPVLSSLLPFDETASSSKDLFDIFQYVMRSQFERKAEDKLFPIFHAEIMPRNSGAYLGKILNVSPQNIWLMKKRGNMDTIRTLELLAVDTFDA